MFSFLSEIWLTILSWCLLVITDVNCVNTCYQKSRRSPRAFKLAPIVVVMLPEASNVEAVVQHLNGKRDQKFLQAQIFCFKRNYQTTILTTY